MKHDKKKYLRRLIGGSVALAALAAGGLGHVYFTAYIDAKPALNAEAGGEGKGSGHSVVLSSFSAIQLVQKIVNAVQSKADVKEIYRSIPLHQLNGVSYEVFSSYVDLIRKNTSFTIDTFSAMNTSTRDRVQRNMLLHMPEQRTLIEKSQFFWLENSSDPTTSGKIPFIVPQSMQGEPYLSKAWFERCIDLYEYSRFYFDILSRGDVKELSRLLHSDSSDPEMPEIKARLLIDYYRRYNVDFGKDVAVSSLRMDEINVGVTLSRKASDTGDDAFLLLKREMGIVYTGRGDFLVEDDVYNGLDRGDYTVRRSDTELFCVGDYIRSEAVAPLLGSHTEVLAAPLPSWLNYEGQGELLNIIGEGISLQVIGVYFPEEQKWEGFVRSASLFSEAYETARVKPGITRDEALAIYPFLDDRNYLLTTETRELYIACDDNQRVQHIRVTDRRFDR